MAPYLRLSYHFYFSYVYPTPIFCVDVLQWKHSNTIGPAPCGQSAAILTFDYHFHLGVKSRRRRRNLDDHGGNDNGGGAAEGQLAAAGKLGPGGGNDAADGGGELPAGGDSLDPDYDLEWRVEEEGLDQVVQG